MLFGRNFSSAFAAHVWYHLVFLYRGGHLSAASLLPPFGKRQPSKWDFSKLTSDIRK